MEHAHFEVGGVARDEIEKTRVMRVRSYEELRETGEQNKREHLQNWTFTLRGSI